MGKEKIRLYYKDRDSLPEQGWFQTCIVCGTVTSNTIDYLSKLSKYNKIIFETWCCYHCNRIITIPVNYKKFAKICRTCTKCKGYRYC